MHLILRKMYCCVLLFGNSVCIMTIKYFKLGEKKFKDDNLKSYFLNEVYLTIKLTMK